jgi:hypothetical protein
LEDLIIAALDALKRHAMPRGARDKRRNDEVQRPVANYAKPKGYQGCQRAMFDLSLSDDFAEAAELILVKGVGCHRSDTIAEIFVLSDERAASRREIGRGAR